MICAKTSLDEAQTAAAGVFVEDLSAGDIRRHQVRRELDTFEIEIQNVRQRANEQRLREARHARDQAVTAGEERHQHVVDDIVLSDDNLSQFVEDAFAAFSDALDAVSASLRLVVQTRASFSGS